MQSNVLLLLSARARKISYIVFGLFALAVSAAMQGLSVIDYPIPDALKAISAVVGVLAVPFSAVAASNVSKDNPPRVIEGQIGVDEVEPERELIEEARNG